MAVAHHQGAPLLILLSSGRLDVVPYLGFEGLGEHPPRASAGDLVEIEGEFFAALLVLMYFTLQKIIRGKISPDSVIHSDGWRSYDGLVDLGYDKHYRINESSKDPRFSNEHSHINGTEAFWGTVKIRMAKRRGIRREMLYLHLKECEFRFNHRNENLYHYCLNYSEINHFSSLEPLQTST